jgi:hypothetical protein
LNVFERPVVSDKFTPSVAVMVAFLLAACANVAPYQRGRLAHPTMNPGDAESAGRAHVYVVQEGAVGGTPGATSGCGCN